MRKVFQKTFVMTEHNELDVVVNEFKKNNICIATTNLAVPYNGGVLFIAVVHYEKQE